MNFRAIIQAAKIDAIVQVGVGYAKELEWLLPLCSRPIVYGFEPSPKAQHFWTTHSYPGLLFSIALGAGRGRIVLNEGGRFEKSSVVHKPGRSRPVEVDVDTLDAFQRRYGVVGRSVLLWMDCEGSEVAVLSGARHFLRNVSVVVAEVVDNPANNWPRRDEIAAALESKGLQSRLRMLRIGECFSRRA